jgi:hypothetical protein
MTHLHLHLQFQPRYPPHLTQALRTSPFKSLGAFPTSPVRYPLLRLRTLGPGRFRYRGITTRSPGSLWTTTTMSTSTMMGNTLMSALSAGSGVAFWGGRRVSGRPVLAVVGQIVLAVEAASLGGEEEARHWEMGNLGGDVRSRKGLPHHPPQTRTIASTSTRAELWVVG